MTDKETCELITARIFRKWADALAEKSATPMFLIGVGHQEHDGEIVLCTPAGRLLPDHELIPLLDELLMLLKVRSNGR